MSAPCDLCIYMFPYRGVMPSGLARMLRSSGGVLHHTAGVQTEPPFLVAQRCLSSRPRDYGLPNPSWSQCTRELYDKFVTLTQDGSWRPYPTYANHSPDGERPETKVRKTRRFTRHIDEDGVGFEYSMFYNKDEKRLLCIFQPGPYLEGPPGYVHGGCIATIMDLAVGIAAQCSCGEVMTAKLNINYRNPVLLGSTVLLDSRVEKVEGRKIYTSCQVRSHDDSVLHAEATGLIIKINSAGKPEAKL